MSFEIKEFVHGKTVIEAADMNKIQQGVKDSLDGLDNKSPVTHDHEGVYVKVSDVGSLTGPQGQQGEEGPTGPQGPKGDPGAPFDIKKIYRSVDEMNADYSGTDVKEREFVIITTDDVNSEDNSKIYIKGATKYDFINDMSGAVGIQGPEGAQGLQGLQGEAGPEGPQGSVGANGADGSDGREIELGKSSTHIQWRYVGGTDWTDIVALTDITGPQGSAGLQGEQGPEGAPGQDGVNGTFDDSTEFSELKTTAKTIVSAINELFDLINSPSATRKK